MRRHVLSAAIVCLAACAMLAGSATSSPSSPAATSGPASSASSDASAVLRSMSQSLAAAQSFSFHANAVVDEPLGSGRMSSFSRVSKITVHRPDKLFVEVQRGNQTRLLWYRGTKLTILDKATNQYATVDVPAGIDKMFDFMAEKYGLVVPLAEFLFPDPYQALTEDAQDCTLVGTHRAAGANCSHLFITQANMDWQLWIDAGSPPLPRKIVMDYKAQRGRPQFTAVLSDWNLSAPVDDQLFEPQLPKDAKKVDMSALTHAQQGE